MKTRHGIVVATLIASLALTGPALASGGKGQAAQKQTRSTVQKQQRHQYGSGTQSRIQQDTQDQDQKTGLASEHRSIGSRSCDWQRQG
jgi:hypothetical protein